MSGVKYESSCIRRFLKYVTVDTRSQEGSDTFPSTDGQWDLLRLLLGEMKELGIEDAELDERGYLFGTLPATTSKPDVPTVGFLAHVDTSPEMSGAGVKPIVHENYQGQDLVLPDHPEARIKLAMETRRSRSNSGRTSSRHRATPCSERTTRPARPRSWVRLSILLAHPEIPHGPIRIGFTPDEEIGQGARYFDVERFGARCAYTMDGEMLGQLETETFSADAMTIGFSGFNTHPGFARGKMINAIKLLADFLQRLPKDGLSPETTDGYDGFVHPYVVEASVERTEVKLLLRAFQTEQLAEQQALLRKLATETVEAHPGAKVEFEVKEYYRNMKEILDAHPDVTDNAREAIRRTGLELREKPIRGGTDGSKLSFMGLPTPNIFAGEHNFHSRYEWVSERDMHKAVEVIIELAKVWEERA